MRVVLIRSAVAFLLLYMSIFSYSGEAFAQSPLNSNVALQPAKEGVIIRQQLRFARAERSTGSGSIDISRFLSATTVVYGVTDSLTIAATVPYYFSQHMKPGRGMPSSHADGIGDTVIMTKWRMYRNDYGINDTSRIDFLAGVKTDSGATAFSSDSVDPIIGGVWTHFFGRSSVDTDVLYQFNTDGGPNKPDRFRYEGAYLYRISPEEYQSVNPSALFGSVELNGIAETNGDQELFFSPGIQYVTQRWALEATVQLPIWQDINHRAETDYIIGVGFRWQF